MLPEIWTKIILTVVGILVTGLIGWLTSQVVKYKKLIKKEEDDKVKSTINSMLSIHLEPIGKELEDIKKDVSNLQKFETNFQTRLNPVQEELERLKDDTSVMLEKLKEQGISIENIKEKELLLEETTKRGWKYRIRILCHAYITRGYMTSEEFAQLQEMFSLYEALGGNGQTKELYERTLKLDIK